MKCDKCGREVGPEELKCPHCGADNAFALKHAQNMGQFEGKYDATEKEVTDAALKLKGLAVRAAILIVLIIGTIVASWITKRIYRGPDPREAIRANTKKNAAVYSQEMDAFLKKGDYMEYVNYCYAHEVFMVQDDEFKRFRCVNYLTPDYYDCIICLEKIILRSTDPDYFDGLDSDIRMFCNDLGAFLETLENMKEQERNEEYMAYILDIEKEMNAAMRFYFSMDDKELEEFISMSNAKKAVRLEEIFRNE